MVKQKSKMTASQKIMMQEFNQKFFALQEQYWNPIDSESYWDNLTEDAMRLIAEFQSQNEALNNFLSNAVVVFLNSREDMLS